MRVIIAGSRSIKNMALVKRCIKASGFKIDCVVCGCTDGVDLYGKRWAIENHKKVALYPALWTEQGTSAGPIRNQKMSANADALIAIWDGKSRGTLDMIQRAVNSHLKLFVFTQS